MRTILPSSGVIAILWLGITGIMACDVAYQTVDSSLPYNVERPPLPADAGSTESAGSDSFTIQSSLSGSNTSLATSSGSEEDLSMDISSTNSRSVTGVLTVTTELLSPGTDPRAVNVNYEIYQGLPQHVSYDGYHTIHYEVAGTPYSYGFNSEQRQLLTILQQEVNEAGEPLNSSSGTCSSCQLAVPSSPSTVTSQPDIFEKMTEPEIVRWLEKLGYRVKKLDGSRFQVTRRYTKRDGSLSPLRITSVFDAGTGLFEPGYSAFREHVPATEYLSKVDRKTGRMHALSKTLRLVDMERSEYLFMDIIRRQNQ